MTRLLSLPEVARRLDLHPKTLSDQVRLGTALVMPCIGGGAHGRRYKFREADVERALATASLTQQRLRLARRSA